MKLVSRIIFIFILALVVAGISELNTGEAIFLVGKYQVQLSVNLLIILLVLLFIFTYYILRIYINIRRIPSKIQNSRFKSRLVSSKIYLNQAGVHFFEGKYRSCYDNAMKSIKKEPNEDNKFMAYLIAYKSACIMRDSEKEHLLADKLQQFNEPKWMLSKYLAVAESLYNQQQYGLCIDNLNAALKIDHHHVPAHFMLMKVYLNLKNYAKSYEMLEWLMQNDSIRDYKAVKYKYRVLNGIFKDASDLNIINKVYNKLDKVERVSFQYAKLYFDALLRNDELFAATEFLEKNHKESGVQLMFAESILALSKLLHDKQQINRVILIAEMALNYLTNDTRLLIGLGILSYKIELWKKSQAYLEASVGIEASQDGYVYLAMIAKETKNDELLNKYLNEILNYLHKE